MYQNGKIYKLVSDSTDRIYIGSTCNPLYKRLGGHKTASKNLNKCYTSKELVKFDDCKIILIEDFACERKEQLTARERYHIEQNKDICVNKIIPTRTNKEYREQNKDIAGPFIFPEDQSQEEGQTSVTRKEEISTKGKHAQQV